MKKILVVVLLAAVGYVVYANYLATATPGGPVETAIVSLDERLQEAVRALNAARRAGGLTGTDMSEDGRAARDEILRIEEQIEILRRRSTAPEEVRALDAFQRRVAAVKESYRLE